MMILREFGGIYLDLDNQIKNNFDILLHYDFFCGDFFFDGSGNSFMGTIPQHPTIIRTLEIAMELITKDSAISRRDCRKDMELQFNYAGSRTMYFAFVEEANISTRDVTIDALVYFLNKKC